MKTKTIIPILTTTIFSLAACQPADRPQAADLVLTNGYIYTTHGVNSFLVLSPFLWCHLRFVFGTPVILSSKFPGAVGPRREAISKKTIPAIASTSLVAFNMKSMNFAIGDNGVSADKP